jgi:hypothetical protein
MHELVNNQAFRAHGVNQGRAALRRAHVAAHETRARAQLGARPRRRRLVAVVADEHVAAERLGDFEADAFAAAGDDEGHGSVR